MASISFGGVYLAPASDLSDTLYLEDAIGFTGRKRKSGEVREYAGGRLRLITRSGESNLSTVKAQHMEREDRVTLEGLVGRLVLYRDGRGRMFYGTILDLQAEEEVGYMEWCTCTFTVSEVTHSQEV